jgi:hypothetical protein
MSVGVAVYAAELFAYGPTAACIFVGFETAEHVEAFRRYNHGPAHDRQWVPGLPRQSCESPNNQ